MKLVMVFYGVVVKVNGISCIMENTGWHVMSGQQSDLICQQDSAMAVKN